MVTVSFVSDSSGRRLGAALSGAQAESKGEAGRQRVAMTEGPATERQSCSYCAVFDKEPQHRHRVEVLVDRELKVQPHFVPAGS